MAVQSQAAGALAGVVITAGASTTNVADCVPITCWTVTRLTIEMHTWPPPSTPRVQSSRVASADVSAAKVGLSWFESHKCIACGTSPVGRSIVRFNDGADCITDRRQPFAVELLGMAR